MSSVSVNIKGEVFNCNNAFDPDNGDFIEVRTEKNRLIGEMYNTSIPDENDKDSVEYFSNNLENWLGDNY